MTNKQKYEQMNREIAEFVEKYKKFEFTPEQIQRSKVHHKVPKIIKNVDKVSYHKVRYKYKGRYYSRRIVAGFTKGE